MSGVKTACGAGVGGETSIGTALADAGAPKVPEAKIDETAPDWRAGCSETAPNWWAGCSCVKTGAGGPPVEAATACPSESGPRWAAA